MINPERWLPVFGFEGYYEVSDIGRVRRLSQATDRVRRIHPRRDYSPRVLSGRKIGDYVYVDLSVKNQQTRRSLHELVLSAFVGFRPAGLYGCHNDGNPQNNKLSNLRWDTPKANQADRVSHGNDQFGENNASSKLTNDERQVARTLRSGGFSFARIAKRFGVCAQTILNLCRSS
jgi:hypothetical protein